MNCTEFVDEKWIHLDISKIYAYFCKLYPFFKHTNKCINYVFKNCEHLLHKLNAYSMFAKCVHIFA